jgi:hypothetical protein
MDNRQERRRAAAAPISPARRVPFSRWLLVVLGLLAMSAQSLLVQTHVHLPRSSDAGLTLLAAEAVAVAPVDGDASPIPQPESDDALKCPLCQQWQAGNHFTAPSFSLLSLPLLTHLSLAVLDDPAFAVSVLTHPWHGRAPPNT